MKETGNAKRGGEFLKMNECVYKWFEQSRVCNIPISGPLVLAKAEEFAEKMNIQDFKASLGWFTEFNERYGISFKHMCDD